MSSTMRFGRRIALPSTRQIRHELLVFASREEARQKALTEVRDGAAEPPAPAPEAIVGQT